MPGTRDSATALRTTTIRTTATTFDAPGDGASSPNVVPAELTIDAVFDAYFDCRRHKRNTINQLRFEADLETNLVALYRDLIDGRYVIGQSLAFVVARPKIREIWAADFRDRVVHHLIYNAISDRYYRRFIRDTYGCIPGRGIHDGMRRVTSFARSATRNWSHPAFAMKIDVANFFNSIERDCLLPLLDRHVPEEWLRALIRQVLFHDPRANAIFRSSRELFGRVPRHKSLLHAPEGKGLPIGNLTSQFFANVYLNEADQYIKHGLKAVHYGRYVDDMILFHQEAEVLNDWYEKINGFLQENLRLRLHPNKKWLNSADAGINFAGFIIKPGRVYLRRSSLARCSQKIRAWERREDSFDGVALRKLSDSLNSYLGMLRQVNGYNDRTRICRRVESLFLRADWDCRKISCAAARASQPRH